MYNCMLVYFVRIPLLRTIRRTDTPAGYESTQRRRFRQQVPLIELLCSGRVHGDVRSEPDAP